MRFIKDSEYIRNSTPMTKEEIRAVIMAKLSIEKDECIFDIGAGTGSISIQSALYAYEGKVYAVECDTEAVEAIRQNIKKFNINNIEIIEGRAPDIIKDRGYSADKIFIGGSSGEIVRIVDAALNILKDGGMLVMSFIVLENLLLCLNKLKESGYSYEVISMQVSAGKEIGTGTMMIANNPIYILTMKKERG